jgi:SAM-dependent methyltransferase
MLDVGCAKGIFLKIDGNAGYTVTGLEPNEQFVQEIRSWSGTVINGFFPDAAALSNKTFDVIIFNDSIEHIPDLGQVVKGIKDHLADNGIVIINVPTSDGLIFQTAGLLNKFGMNKPFDRLWQKNYSSPHIHYFNKRNLKLLFEKNGFSQRYCMTSPHYTIKGLWKRISRTYSVFTTFFIWFFMVLLYPIFRIKSNSILVIFLYDPGIAQ